MAARQGQAPAWELGGEMTRMVTIRSVSAGDGIHMALAIGLAVGGPFAVEADDSSAVPKVVASLANGVGPELGLSPPSR